MLNCSTVNSVCLLLIKHSSCSSVYRGHGSHFILTFIHLQHKKKKKGKQKRTQSTHTAKELCFQLRDPLVVVWQRCFTGGFLSPSFLPFVLSAFYFLHVEVCFLYPASASFILWALYFLLVEVSFLLIALSCCLLPPSGRLLPPPCFLPGLYFLFPASFILSALYFLLVFLSCCLSELHSTSWGAFLTPSFLLSTWCLRPVCESFPTTSCILLYFCSLFLLFRFLLSTFYLRFLAPFWLPDCAQLPQVNNNNNNSFDLYSAFLSFRMYGWNLHNHH